MGKWDGKIHWQFAKDCQNGGGVSVVPELLTCEDCIVELTVQLLMDVIR